MNSIKYKIGLFFLVLTVITAFSIFFWRNSNKPILDKVLDKKSIKTYKELDSLLKYDLEQADLKVKELYNQSKKSKDSLSLAYAYFYREVVERSKYRNDSLFYLLEKASKLATNTGDEDLKARINYEFGLYYSHKDNYPKSIEYLLSTKQYFEKNNEAALAQFYNMLGSIYLHMDDIKQSSIFHQKAYEISEKNNDTVGKAIHYANIGKLLIRQSDYKHAKEKLKSSFKTFEALKDTLTMIKVLTFLSDAELYSGNTEASISYIERAYNFTKSFNDISLEGHILLHYGNIYEHNENYEKALYYYLKGLKMADCVYLDFGTLKTISNIYFKKNRLFDAYNFLEKYYQVKDSINGAEIKSQIESMQWENKLKEQEYKNEILKKNKEIDKQKYLNRTRVYFFLIITTLGIALLLALLYRNKKKSLLISLLEQKRLTEKAKAETKLKKMNQEKHEYELDKKNRELVAMNIQLLLNTQFLSEVEKVVENNVKAEDMEKELKQMIRNLDNKEKSWEKFKAAFQKIHPTFFATIQNKYPQLSKAEIRICMYIKINMDNNEIATLLSIEYRSLITIRSRIRKKLNLDKNDNLDEFVKTW